MRSTFRIATNRDLFPRPIAFLVAGKMERDKGVKKGAEKGVNEEAKQGAGKGERKAVRK